ncbi:MarR family transcriptional regulator [Marinobacter nanhaiticus D15-8W]|uniref:MarR family transcriptional regulator n=1 Tax=Marinobacter nanhaiticus D15-8W TaxID=626887 RepID=N6WY86_9GAMM|nr:MarR family transcriptional regulator [Marinobacter nanhaiticus]ENO13723.2 MarR family transcriptional regulator [Marinobacter nanhaiticus D15-8W]BES71096.1 MarR family transcriptional regulator [Marinobacter nanhaiticus D15-8W]
MTAKNDNPLALDNQVCFALYAANRAMTTLYRPLLEELGLTYPQYLVMLVLWEADRPGYEDTSTELISVSWLGRRLRLDSGTLTPLLKRLEARGLICRSRHTDDERVVTLTLTGEGRELRDRALDIPGNLLCRSGLGLEDARTLRQSLQRLLDQLPEK